MDDILNKLSHCIEFGKTDRASPWPPDMKDQDGAHELALKALELGHSPDLILESLVAGMEVVGRKFSENKIFVPQMLMSAKAMKAAMEHLKPAFESGRAKRKGIFVIGTVQGDLHDIGKNIVAMYIEGNGYEVVDLGVDVKPEQFLAEIEKRPECVVGLSALLTTTMINMKRTVALIREKHPNQVICVGGAPVTEKFCRDINADFYSPDPQGAVTFLNKLAS
ncbi:MAG: cobalamin-binding protein [Balneolaceae bacterium]|nr:MAG: cobalamin-binding protein [Balneolaceae bacterium]